MSRWFFSFLYTCFYPSNLQGVQKDINMLNGKLERSFFEICMAMKTKIRNKEPYVEHSMGLLRLAYPLVYIMCYITFALISPNASFNLPLMWQKMQFLERIYSNISLLAVECWLCSRHFLRVMIQSRREDETGCLLSRLLIDIHLVSCYHSYLTW